jgi:hypothetical protein
MMCCYQAEMILVRALQANLQYLRSSSLFYQKEMSCTVIVMRSKREKVLLVCARSARKHWYYARKARKSTASMRAMRAKTLLKRAKV